MNKEITYLETGTLKMLTARSVKYTAAAIQVYHTSSVDDVSLPTPSGRHDGLLPTMLAGNQSSAVSNFNPGAKSSLLIALIFGTIIGTLILLVALLLGFRWLKEKVQTTSKTAGEESTESNSWTKPELPSETADINNFVAELDGRDINELEGEIPRQIDGEERLEADGTVPTEAEGQERYEMDGSNSVAK